MKTLLLILCLSLALHHTAHSQCNSGPYTVTGNSVITGSCIITGDLTLLNGATLNVDLTGPTPDTFVVRGNILLQGNAALWIHATPGSTGDKFIVSNSHSGQRTITTKDSSRISLENIEFGTQEGNLTNGASVYMSFDAEDHSIFNVNNCWLDNRKAWMLFNLHNNATLMGNDANQLPTEIYLGDTAQVSLQGVNTSLGIWLTFQDITGTLTLPADQSKPFTWKIGRGVGGVNTQWYLELDTVKCGVGMQILPNANITINGTGLPFTGETKVALLFANNTETIKDLHVGLQNTTVSNGPNGKVTLNNVNLGPIAWQLYALMNEHLTIRNSVVNEIGIAGPSTIDVDSSLLQLAVLAAVGVGGSTLTVNNSEIWNQAITATNNSRIVLNNCNVTGSAFSTTDATSRITVNGGCFFANPSGCSPATMLDIATGQPHCNPFIPPGFPQNLSPAAVTFNGVNSNCSSGVMEKGEMAGVEHFPNPSNNVIHVTIPRADQRYSIEVYSLLGQRLMHFSDNSAIDISVLAEGIYMLVVKQGRHIDRSTIVKQ